MKSTTKNDYIEITCKQFCDNYNNCDLSHIYINDISGKTTKIGCSYYRRKVGTDENKTR